ncbi:hypothetical protein Dxin01_00122 [Deinococcus xinjiangensis]|uniref:Uncharacterized protein n=1 Tax=Deinococcus xinjiangensis TaxID=457454 RepID=A0ABP9V569_9DEIO
MKLTKYQNPVQAMLDQQAGAVVLTEASGVTYRCQCESDSQSLQTALNRLTSGEISADELGQLTLSLTALLDGTTSMIGEALTNFKHFYKLEAAPAKIKKERAKKERVKKIKMGAGLINASTLSDAEIWGDDFLEERSPFHAAEGDTQQVPAPVGLPYL